MVDSEATKNSNASISTINGNTGPSANATVDTTFKANLFHVYLLGMCMVFVMTLAVELLTDDVL